MYMFHPSILRQIAAQDPSGRLAATMATTSRGTREATQNVASSSASKYRAIGRKWKLRTYKEVAEYGLLLAEQALTAYDNTWLSTEGTPARKHAAAMRKVAKVLKKENVWVRASGASMELSKLAMWKMPIVAGQRPRTFVIQGRGSTPWKIEFTDRTPPVLTGSAREVFDVVAAEWTKILGPSSAHRRRRAELQAGFGGDVPWN